MVCIDFMSSDIARPSPSIPVARNHVPRSKTPALYDNAGSPIGRSKFFKDRGGKGKSGEGFPKTGKFFTKNQETQEKAKSFAEMRKEKGDAKEGEKKKFNKMKPKECWLCGKQGHFRNECPSKKENAD